ncbi:MAG: hypothetical protein DWQ44_11250 [Bacteroidetes bacterium]|nr:MAG: hypothetical protein DWQ33_09370 [Bacteroidota bacterium]REK05198.1 MAG: hypothetical protein DWQ39_08380 [Bacteroidota bacterium]REK32603.1 MAG: hypothetical protein DWQ44_11250 [Bacteroidota bacterium]REK48950.1 MAG: hypothetical protein DWQ48_08710 [Bacteroidota bacterium]
MQKFSDLTKEVFTKIQNRENFQVEATRKEIKFEGIEEAMKSQNFDYPFVLSNIFLTSGLSILAHEAAGLVQLDLIDRIRILTDLNQGTIVYERIGNGDRWKVSVLFKK